MWTGVECQSTVDRVRVRDYVYRESSLRVITRPLSLVTPTSVHCTCGCSLPGDGGRHIRVLRGAHAQHAQHDQVV